MAGTGGARPGAGRKAGVPNKRTREVVENARKGGILPLDYMLKVMRNPKAPEVRRDEMARAAAPYVHPRLQAIQHSGAELGDPIQFIMQNRPEKEKR